MVGDKMNTEERREKILERLQQAEKPLTGTALSKEFAVSRQIIVGDISILRALGTHVYATPRGYIIPAESREKQGVIATLACRHSLSDMLKELCIIVDNGGFVRDVIVEHPLYGEMTWAFAVPKPRTNSTMAPDRLSVALLAAGESRFDVRLMEARARHETMVPANAAAAATGWRTNRKQTIAARLT